MRDSLLMCLSDLSLVSDLTGARLSPLGDCSCFGVVVPAVALVVLLVDTTGDGVVPDRVLGLFDVLLFCVEGACLDLERLDETGILCG